MNWITNYTWNNLQKPILCICFDDGYRTDKEVFLDSRGIKGTSYAITGMLTGEIPRDDRLTWDDVKVMLKLGWGIECHTHTHTNLTTLTESQMHQEMQNVNAAFAGQGLQTPKHHAFPQSGYNEAVISVLSQYRETLRGGILEGGFAYADVEWYPLMSAKQVDMRTEAELNNIKNVIASAAKNNKVVLVLLHELKDTVPTAEEYKCYKPYFWEMVDFAISKGMNIWTVGSMYNYVKYVNGL